jgi:hypothetical protein
LTEISDLEIAWTQLEETQESGKSCGKHICQSPSVPTSGSKELGGGSPRGATGYVVMGEAAEVEAAEAEAGADKDEGFPRSYWADGPSSNMMRQASISRSDSKESIEAVVLI